MKLNKKGYMLVEIVVASVLAMSIAYYLLDLTYNFKDKAEDLYFSYLYTKDKVLITKNIKSDLERGTIIDVIENENDNTKEINFYLKLPDNPTPEPRKIKFSKNSNGKTTIEYGKTTNNNFVENDVSYYKKELQSSLIIGELDFKYSGEKSNVTINIPIKSIYDDKSDYSIKIYSDYYEPNYMKQLFSSTSDYTYFRQDEYREKILNIYFVDYINTNNSIKYWGVSENESNPERITAWLQNSKATGYYDLYIGSHDIIYARSLYSLFKDMPNIQTISFSNLDTSLTNNMGYLFYNCKSLKELNLSNFNTTNVTSMSAMFFGTGYQNTEFKLILGEYFDTTQVTRMDLMFYQTGYNSSNFSIDLGNKFDTTNVTTMNSMFFQTGYNSSEFTIDLGEKFNTSNVTNMNKMFLGVGHNCSVFNLDLGNKFNTSNITDMNLMFSSAGSKSAEFNLDLGEKFDTSNVTDMHQMFANAGTSSNTFTLDLGEKFDTSNVTDMHQMFEGIGGNSIAFTLDLGEKFDTSNVTNMDSMFINCEAANTTITIRNINTTYDKMFANAAKTEGAKIVVNYTSETEDLVDNMILTKYSDSNIVKGSLVN